jgi:hypothetical protein
MGESWVNQHMPLDQWPAPVIMSTGDTSALDHADFLYADSPDSTAPLLPGHVTAARYWRIRFGSPGGNVLPMLEFETSVFGMLDARLIAAKAKQGASHACSTN